MCIRRATVDLPFQFDPEALRRRLGFALTSKLGDIALLGKIVDGGGLRPARLIAEWPSAAQTQALPRTPMPSMRPQ